MWAKRACPHQGIYTKDVSCFVLTGLLAPVEAFVENIGLLLSSDQLVVGSANATINSRQGLT